MLILIKWKLLKDEDNIKIQVVLACIPNCAIKVHFFFISIAENTTGTLRELAALQLYPFSKRAWNAIWRNMGGKHVACYKIGWKWSQLCQLHEKNRSYQILNIILQTLSWIYNILYISCFCIICTDWVNLNELNVLTHCGLVTPYADIDLGQHWFRHWLVINSDFEYDCDFVSNLHTHLYNRTIWSSL